MHYVNEVGDNKLCAGEMLFSATNSPVEINI